MKRILSLALIMLVSAFVLQAQNTDSKISDTAVFDTTPHPDYKRDSAIAIIDECLHSLMDQLDVDISQEQWNKIDSLIIKGIDATIGTGNPNIYQAYREKYGYGAIARSNTSFLLSMCRTGSQPFGGLASGNAGQYTPNSFLSYQLEYSYAFLMKRHWSMSLGLGYESDVCKWKNMNYSTSLNIPDFYTGTATLVNQKQVSRYINMPISLAYSNKDFGRGRWGVAVTLLPGLTLTGKHQGWKREYLIPNTNDEIIVRDRASDNRLYKCDLRFDIRLRTLNLFVQTSLIPTDTYLNNYTTMVGIRF